MLCASVFIIVVDGTIVNVALPTFVRELGATTSQLQWIVDAYVLVFAGLLMAAGSIGDRFGRKGTLMVGMAAFGGTSIMAALATSPGQLIAWRAAMGVGAALIFPATLALLVNVFTDAKQRADRHLDLGGHQRPGRRAGPRDRRLPARALLLGLGVPGQRAGDRGRHGRDLAGRTHISGHDDPPLRSAGNRAVDRRRQRAGVVGHRRARRTAGPRPRASLRSRLAASLLTAFVRWERRS